jgi:hypothetical protein
VRLDWLPRFIVLLVLLPLFAVARRLAPRRLRAAESHYNESQVPEPLPTGVVGGVMWCLGIALALLFFVLRGANHYWASLEGPSDLTQFAPQVIWCFFPAFAAIAIPWPLTVWYLRRIGRWEEADSIEDDADARGGWNSFRLMKWLSIAVVGPIGVFTVLAIPIHLSITNSEVRVGHYGSWRTERFPLAQARRLTVVDGYRLRDGSFRLARDVVIDFADGRRLRANSAGDGGTSVRDDVMNLLISRTGLNPEHAVTVDEIPPFVAQR